MGVWGDWVGVVGVWGVVFEDFVVVDGVGV